MSKGSPQITLRYRPTDPLGQLLSSLPQGADKTKAVNEALGRSNETEDVLLEALSGLRAFARDATSQTQDRILVLLGASQ